MLNVIFMRMENQAFEAELQSDLHNSISSDDKSGNFVEKTLIKKADECSDVDRNNSSESSVQIVSEILDSLVDSVIEDAESVMSDQLNGSISSIAR